MAMTNENTQAIHSFLKEITQDIESLPEKSFLVTAMQSHTKCRFPRLNSKNVDTTVLDWFNSLSK